MINKLFIAKFISEQAKKELNNKVSHYQIRVKTKKIIYTIDEIKNFNK